MWFDARQALEGRARQLAPCYFRYNRYNACRLARVADVADVAAPRFFRSDMTREQDEAALLTLLEREGPHSYGAAAVTLGIGATRAWAAETALQRAERIRLGPFGRVFVIEQSE